MTIGLVSGSPAYGAGATNPSVTLGTQVNGPGTVIAAWVRLSNSTVPTLTDGVNAGSYILLNSRADATNSIWIYTFFIVVTAQGTPNIATSATGGFGNVAAAAFNGFAGIPTAESGANGSAGAASVSSYSVSPVITGQNGELILGMTAQGSNVPGTPAGWTKLAIGGGALQAFYAVVPTAGTNTPFSASLNTTTWYDAITAGIYDAQQTANVQFASPSVNCPF